MLTITNSDSEDFKSINSSIDWPIEVVNFSLDKLKPRKLNYSTQRPDLKEFKLTDLINHLLTEETSSSSKEQWPKQWKLLALEWWYSFVRVTHSIIELEIVNVG